MMNFAFIISNWNKQSYLSYCLTSCLSQKDNNGELINNKIFIVDDGSTDNSCDIINYFVSEYPGRIIFEPHKMNMGVGYSYNRLIDMVTEYNNNTTDIDSMIDYFIIMGSDDVACDCLISNYRNICKGIENPGLIYSSFHIVDCMFGHIQEKIVLKEDEATSIIGKMGGQAIPHGFTAVSNKYWYVKHPDRKVGPDSEYFAKLILDEKATIKKTEDILNEKGILLNASGYYIINPSSISVTRYNEVQAMDQKYFKSRG